MSVNYPTDTPAEAPWYKQVGKPQWRALVAAGMGWAMDAFDVMMYSMLIVFIMKDLSLNTAEGGLLASVTLLSSALGGIVFGMVADKIGRTKALMTSILLYSIFTAACGFAQNLWQLVAFRALLGLGMGGEWTAGAALITETWPAKHRNKAMGLVQCNWTIGYAAAAFVTMLVAPTYGWRAVFFVGVLPALLTFWVRRRVEEPAIWKEKKKEENKEENKEETVGFRILFSRGYIKYTVVATLVLIFAQFGYWGVFSWIPGYLASPIEKGGAGMSIIKSSAWIMAMQIGGFAGLLSFGFLSDKFNRKRVMMVYFLMAAILVPFYGIIKDPTTLLILGPFVIFFGQGHFSGYGPLLAEIYPTQVRATGQGFAYNIGRGVSAFAPAIVGFLALSKGLGMALAFTSVVFIGALLSLLLLPETKGRDLQ